MTEAATKPIATIRERQKYKTLKLPNSNTGVIEKVRVTAGKETVRTAFCFLHKKHTSKYAGANQNGWVFHCPGVADYRPEPEDSTVEPGHYFIAQEPKR